MAGLVATFLDAVQALLPDLDLDSLQIDQRFEERDGVRAAEVWITEATPGGGNWTIRKGVNCYHGHGATTVPGGEPYSTSISLADCEKACQSDKQCTAIVVQQAGGGPGGQVTDDVLLDGLIKAVNADGFNGDTMQKVGEEFYTTSVRIDHPGDLSVLTPREGTNV